jgi:hypothetical protein
LRARDGVELAARGRNFLQSLARILRFSFTTARNLCTRAGEVALKLRREGRVIRLVTRGDEHSEQVLPNCFSTALATWLAAVSPVGDCSLFVTTLKRRRAAGARKSCRTRKETA